MSKKSTKTVTVKAPKTTQNDLKKSEKAVEVKAVKSKDAVKETKKAEVKLDTKTVLKNDTANSKAEKATVKAESKKAEKTDVKPLVKESAKAAKPAENKKQAKTEKAASEKKETAAKAEAKPNDVKAKKASAVKETKAVKAEKKLVVKAAAKAAEKNEKAETKKAEPEKVKEVKPTENAEAKKTVKAPAKKTAPKTEKKVDQEKLDQYAARSLADCIKDMQKMQVQYDYEDYYRLLLDEADLKKLAKNIIEGNKIKEGNYDYKELGYDIDLVPVTLDKVAETMDIKAADFKEYKKAITKALRFTMGEDAEANAGEYLDEFKLAEKLLMVGQRKDITEAEVLSELIGADVNEYFKHFFEFAYALLPSWQYNDVKYYENFAYAVLSQYSDLYQSEQQRIQMDVADLYIKHGDYQLGDEMYGYILRDNQIKDYIYYRYASVYKDIDYNKAKSIAYSSFQYVDDRYTYYPNILEIVNQ